MGITFNSAL